MKKKRGEYAKNRAREALKDFIVEIYKKHAICNLKKLQEEQFHDEYIRYTKLVQDLNNDREEKKKKAYKIRDAGSNEDFMYFYREATRKIDKSKITKIDKKEQKVKYLQNKEKTLKNNVKREEKRAQDAKEKAEVTVATVEDVLNKLMAETGAYGLYQKRMLEQYERTGFYEKRTELKLKSMETYRLALQAFDVKLQNAARGEGQLPGTIFRDLAEMQKAIKEACAIDKFDVSFPKDAIAVIQQNITTSLQHNQATTVNSQQDDIYAETLNIAKSFSIKPADVQEADDQEEEGGGEVAQKTIY